MVALLINLTRLNVSGEIMINWIEPFEVAKERAKFMKLPLLWIILTSLFSGVFAAVSFL